MWPLAFRLRRAGFAVRRVGYPSTRAGIGGSVAHVRATLAATTERLGADWRLDLVGHSLGGLIAVRLLREPGDLIIGRVVQLGSPNLGSVMADRLGGFRLVRRVCGPAVEDLRAHDLRAPVEPRIAAIAGTGGFWRGPLLRPHDGTVSVRSAWAGAAHRTHVPVLHALLPAPARVAALVGRFLRDGRFAGPPA